MRIVTWNINGIRSLKPPLKAILDSLDADVICLQEAKITRNMLDTMTAQVDGYNAYFSLSRKRPGYSGVVTYCRNSCIPCCAEEGLSGQLPSSVNDGVGVYVDEMLFTKQQLVDLDSEGRAVITQHQIKIDETTQFLCVINVYCPRADPDRDDRVTYKHNFYHLLQARSESLVRACRYVIIAGDINATHKNIDHCDPAEQSLQAVRARQWLDQMIWKPGRDKTLAKKHQSQTPCTAVCGGMFLDTFRHCNPTQAEAYTNWTTLTGARQTNYGRRLDYILIDTKFVETVSSCEILASVEGSDHCPVRCTIDIECVSSVKFPQLCARFLPEVIGIQQKLSTYFSIGNETTEATQKLSDELLQSKHIYTSTLDAITVEKPNSLCIKYSTDFKNSTKTPDHSNTKAIHTLSLSGYDCNNYTSHNLQKRSLKAASVTSKRCKTSKAHSEQTSLTSYFNPSNIGTFHKTGVNCKQQNYKTIECKPGERSFKNFTENTDYLHSCMNRSNHIPTDLRCKSQKTHSTDDNIVECATAAICETITKPDCHTPECSDCITMTSHSNSSQAESDYHKNKQKCTRLNDDCCTGTHPQSTKPTSTSTNNIQTTKAIMQWKSLLSGLPPPPLCKGHNEPCVLRTVKKLESVNKGRRFYVCNRPQGSSHNQQARCDHFQWFK